MTIDAITAAQAPSRGRAMAGLFTGVALTGTAMAGASAVSTLIAADTAGERWSGVPNSMAVIGTALGALGLGALISRHGHRAGLITGYMIAAVGASLAVWGVLASAFPLLLLGMMGMGVGNGSAQLARYSAAELYPRDRKGFALSVIVWAGTVGGIAGPMLIAPTARLAERLSLPALAGPFLLTLTAVTAAALASRSLPTGARAALDDGLRLRLRASWTALRLPAVKVALAGMLVAQLDMVAVMTMAPLHMHHHGHGLSTVGLVLTAHMLGMFVLSPLTGRLADRIGGARTIVLGMAVLALAAAVTVTAPADRMTLLPIALFLLGYGWNLAFVGGSSLLSRNLPADGRAQAEGLVDALVWGSSAAASIAAGVVLDLGGYGLVTIASGGLILVPLVVVARNRSARFDGGLVRATGG